MKRLTISALLVLGLQAQSLSFSPQSTANGITTWAVTACGGPVSVSRIYALAGQHGIAWLLPANASAQTMRRSGWAQVVRYGGFAAAATSALIGLKVIAVSAAIEQGAVAGAGFLNVLLPLARQQVSSQDSTIGAGLVADTDGCGTAQFFALAGKKAKPFTADVGAKAAATQKDSFPVQLAGKVASGHELPDGRGPAVIGLASESVQPRRTRYALQRAYEHTLTYSSARFEMGSDVSAEFLTR